MTQNTKTGLNRHIREIKKRVAKWPAWKQAISITDPCPICKRGRYGGQCCVKTEPYDGY